MKILLLAFISLTINCFSSLQAQVPSVVNVSMYALNIGEEMNTVTLNDPVSLGFRNDFEAIEGGPYYNDEWLKGRVVLKSGQVVGSEWLFKYNTFQDELHIQLKSGNVKIPVKEQIQSFMIEKDGKQHYFVNSAQTGIVEKEDNVFFEVLHSERFTLLKKSSKHYGELENDEFYCSTCNNTPFSFFFVSEKYYVKDRKGKFKSLKLTKKSISNALPKSQYLFINSYWKKNRNKMKTEQGLLDLLQHIES